MALTEPHNHTPAAGASSPESHTEMQLSGRKLLGIILLNAGITAVQAVGGILSGSLALLSDAVHNLSDAISIALTYAAWRIAKRGRNRQKTYGYKRAEILAAFVNASSLLVICLFLVIAAVKHFQHPEPIRGTLMIWVALFAIIANLISVLLLQRESHGNLNIRSSFLHLLGDTISSVVVLLGGLAIHFFEWYWVDPIATIIIALYVAWESFSIVRKTVDILMQSAAPLDYEGLQADIQALPGVRNVHHLHTWLSDENTIYLEAHVEMEDGLLSEIRTVQDKANELLRVRYGVSHATLQFESDQCEDKSLFKV
jgi:cobalt-zinc-cadmium efflux system protein